MNKPIILSGGLLLVWLALSVTSQAATLTFTWTPTLTQTVTPTESPVLSPTMTPSASVTGTISPTITMSCTEVVATRVRLNRNSINPLRGDRVSIFGLSPDHGEVTIKIYTQEGILIRLLWENRQPQFLEVADWDGKNENGTIVASGIYMVVIKGKKLKKRLRIAVIK